MASLFFNEVEVLDVKINVLNDLVDTFVLKENIFTFSGKEKPPVLPRLFSKYDKKVFNFRYIQSNLKLNNPWLLEDQLRQELVDIDLAVYPDKDILILGDLDEIPKPETIKKYVNEIYPNPAQMFFETSYLYFNTTEQGFQHRGCLIMPFSYWRTKRLKFRSTFVGNNFYNLTDAGWHFSSAGNGARIQKKAVSFSHTELAHLDKDHFDLMREQVLQPWTKQPLEIKPISWLPSYVKNNLKTFKDFIYV